MEGAQPEEGEEGGRETRGGRREKWGKKGLREGGREGWRVGGKEGHL
jgi:hypothetical protein